MSNAKSTHQHGGDLYAIEQKYNIPKSDIIDFSGNINPLGFPSGIKKLLSDNIDLVCIYPDKNYTALKESISIYTGADIENIAVGNGSTELISAFIKSICPKKAIILGPAYSEYENELKKIGSSFDYFPLDEKDDFVLQTKKLLNVLTEDIDFFVACNPNNPTGTVIEASQMDIIAMHCKKNSISIMIDETYIEFCDDINKVCSIPLTKAYDNIFVIRGISKFFAAPGIRLGYGITSNKGFHNLLTYIQDPWSVNILAAFSGEHLFTDKRFIEETCSLISTERIRILNELKTWKNIKTYPSSSNFILVKLLNNRIKSSEIFHNLIRKKLLIRDAESFTFLDSSYIRFCILSPQKNQMLIESLKEIIEN